jgi:ABC-2 type transport system permease protein
MAAPMPNWVILLGYVLGGVLRGLMVGAIVLVVAMFFTTVRIPHPLITLSTVLLAATVFSLAGFVNAVYAKKFDDIAIIPTFVLTPLIYLGGVFYSMDLLSDFWAGVSKLNPLVYVVNAFRYGVLGVSDVSLSFAFGMIAFFTALAWFYSMHLLNTGKRLRQ